MTKLYDIDGHQITLRQISEETGIDMYTLYQRVHRGKTGVGLVAPKQGKRTSLDRPTLTSVASSKPAEELRSSDHVSATPPKRGRAPSPMTVMNGRLRYATGAARAHVASCNRKLAPVVMEPTSSGTRKFRPKPVGPFCVSTYVSIKATCPKTCPFIDGGGCYVDSGFTAIASAQMNEAATEHGMTGIAVIHEETRLLRALFGGKRIPQDGARGGRDLRLHVGGDVPDGAGARLLAYAADNWHARGGGAVWTFSHRWRSIERSAWGRVSVLASVEHGRDFAAARAQGYAPAIVVDRFRGDRAFTVPGGGAVKVIPCPAETKEGVTCVQCRLCLDRDLVGMNAAIGFSAHGPQAEEARTQLVWIRKRPEEMMT